MSWGSNWGTNWGGCDSDFNYNLPENDFFVVSAHATSSKTYVVQFSQPPEISSPIGPNDAANIGLVELVRLDTGAIIPLLAAGPVPGQPTLVEFLLLGVFTSAQITYETRHTDLITIFGEPLVDPKTAQFDGMPQQQLLRERTQALIDYYNPQAEDNLINGGLVVGTDADYEFEAGASLMRKLIIRRVVTAQDEFFHLSDREYGLGVQPKLTYTEADLIQFKRQLEREVQKEPEVSRSVVSLSLSADHTLTVIVRAKLLATGQQIEVSVPLDFSSQTTPIS